MDKQESKVFDKIDWKISISHVYNAKINSVWKIIKDMKFSVNLVSGLRSDFELVKGDNSYTEGNEFKFLLKQKVSVIGKVSIYLSRWEK